MENNMNTVKEFRQAGYKVRVIHKRETVLYRRGFSQTRRISEKGGETILQLRTPSGEEFEASAKCSKLDNYNKKIGVRIALGRIRKQLENNSNDCTAQLVN